MNLSRVATPIRSPALRIGTNLLSQRTQPCLHLVSVYRLSTAAAVKELRAQTGAPMMECKKALSSPEVDGDLQKAMEWLRKHGTQKASAKVIGREAPEGLVGICIGEKASSVVKVASETDFASRSETFSGFVQEVADAAAKQGEIAELSAFLTGTKNDSGKLLSESLNDVILSIRENIQVDSISLMKASPNSVFGGYVHNRVAGSNCGSAAAVVELQACKEVADAKEIAKRLAMHVVAARPAYLNPESVPEDVVQKEKEILMEKMADSNKPKEIMEKIITGQLRKFYEQLCLTEQAHMVEEGNPKVGKFLKGLGLEVTGFKSMDTSK